MEIVRQDSDVLVLEARSASAPSKLEFLAALIFSLAMAGCFAAAVHNSAWWRQLASSMQWIVGLASAGGVLSLVFVAREMFPQPICLAFDRTSRRVLCVRQTWRRVYRDEFDFDQVQGLVLQHPLPMRNASWSLRLTMGDRQGPLRVTMSIASCQWTDPLDTLATAIDTALGREHAPLPECKSPLSWALRLAAGGLAIWYATAVGPGHFERWQSPSWPRAEGVVETVQLGKKTYDTHEKKSRFVLADAIEIDYRYSVGGVQYHGTRFNLHQNWLTPQEADWVEERYRPGHACQVAYNPSQPAHSFLTTDGAGAFFSDVKIDAAVGLAGLLWLAWNGWRIARRPVWLEELTAIE